MNAKLIWGITAAILLPLTYGCSQSPGLVRGQSPIEGEYVGQACSMCGGAAGGCSSCCDNDCDDDDDDGLHPSHYHWYSYQQPRNLVYPDQNQPSAVVQYPYYTVKGPSDFFMQ